MFDLTEGRRLSNEDTTATNRPGTGERFELQSKEELRQIT